MEDAKHQQLLQLARPLYQPALLFPAWEGFIFATANSEVCFLFNTTKHPEPMVLRLSLSSNRNPQT